MSHESGTKLPELGPRGEGWVALQGLLIVLIALAGAFGPRWPRPARRRLALASVPFLLAGLWLFMSGGSKLGKQITPFPKPVPEGELREDGAFGLVRHPIYGGVLVVGLAVALIASPLVLVVWVVAAAFLDLKRRREEAWLMEQFPDYEGYRRRVRHKLIPFVW